MNKFKVKSVLKFKLLAAELGDFVEIWFELTGSITNCRSANNEINDSLLHPSESQHLVKYS